MKTYNAKGVSFDQLPKTRKEQFKIIFKTDFFTLLVIGLILLLSAFLLVAAFLLKNMFTADIIAKLVSEDADQIEFLLNDLLINVVFSFILILPFALFAVGISGSYRIMRNLVFNDGVLFRSDFAKGMKLNYWQTFKSFIIVDILLLGCYFLKFLFYLWFSNNIAVVLTAILPVLFIINLLAELTFLSLSSFYNVKTRSGFVVSLILVIKKFPVSLIFGLIIGAFYLVSIFSNLIVNAIVLLLFFVFILPIFLLAHVLYYASIFDGDFNNENPQNKKRGLYVENMEKNYN